MSKPTIPKGTRDFSPSEVHKRNYIFEIIEKVFQNHSFTPIQTPSFEKLSTLNGKYGDEGDQLLFKILLRGEKFNKAIKNSIDNNILNDNNFSEEALRYDLTVPFARYIVQHQNDLNFPFRRYQIQPVWRADRPQKGRYREFYQCDADVVGSNSLNCEIDLITIISEVFNELNLGEHTIFLNNRKVLSALVESCGALEYFKDITIIIDKIDKVGVQTVIEELKNKIPIKNCYLLFEELFSLDKADDQLIDWLKDKIAYLDDGLKGIEELKYLIYNAKELGINNLKLNLSLARGLDYYTGSIFEVVLNNYDIGSVVGGGRYDNLTEVFGKKDLSGVGISFGAERIYDVMNKLSLFPSTITNSPSFMIINQSKKISNGFKLLNFLRKMKSSCFLYPDNHKLKKQLKYANDLNVKSVIFLHDDFSEDMMLDIKNMKTGMQQNIKLKDLMHE